MSRGKKNTRITNKELSHRLKKICQTSIIDPFEKQKLSQIRKKIIRNIWEQKLNHFFVKFWGEFEIQPKKLTSGWVRVETKKSESYNVGNFFFEAIKSSFL